MDSLRNSRKVKWQCNKIDSTDNVERHSVCGKVNVGIGFGAGCVAGCNGGLRGNLCELVVTGSANRLQLAAELAEVRSVPHAACQKLKKIMISKEDVSFVV